MPETIYPLTFEPVFRHYLWGGRGLETILGRTLPPGTVAESWEISGHASSATLVDAGPYRGRALPELLAILGERLVGRNAVGLAPDRFPLLVKLLDAAHDLSLQVHPDDAFARLHEKGELGKTEMWYVLHAEPGAQIIYGLAAGATRESFTAALQTGALEGQLQRLAVAPGDCFHIPAGMLHALLAGVLVAEIQQNSDTTYRVSDWGRLGADGQPRALHIDKALQVIDFERGAPGKVAPELLEVWAGGRRSKLVACPQFVTERIDLDAGARYAGRCDGATCEIWGCLSGRCQLAWSGEPLALAGVRFVLLPASLGDFSLQAETQCTALRTYIPAPGLS
jgi:mannose-6-phosphate isomerase